jgi:hypothetical protein
MSSIINADTSDGLKITSDTSGQIDFQSAGSTKATIDTAGNLKFDSGYGSVATAYGCRAWVNFNGTSTVAIRDSANVSSITDHAVGQFTVNFTTALPDVNYTSVGMSGNVFNAMIVISQPFQSYAPTTTSCRYNTMYQNGGYYYDPEYVGISIFR